MQRRSALRLCIVIRAIPVFSVPQVFMPSENGALTQKMVCRPVRMQVARLSFAVGPWRAAALQMRSKRDVCDFWSFQTQRWWRYHRRRRASRCRDVARRVSTDSRHDMTAVQIHSVPAEWICKKNQNPNTEFRHGRKKNGIFPFLQPFVSQYIVKMWKNFCLNSTSKCNFCTGQNDIFFKQGRKKNPFPYAWMEKMTIFAPCPKVQKYGSFNRSAKMVQAECRVMLA